MPDAIMRQPDETRLARLSEQPFAPATMTDSEAQRVVDELRFVQSLRQGISTARESVLKPLRDKLGMIRKGYDTYLERIETVEARLKQVLLDYRHARDKAAADAARSAIAAQAALAAAEARADAALAGMHPIEANALATGVERRVVQELVTQVTPAVAPNVTEGLIGAVHVSKTWTYEIVDPAAVPRDFLAVDGPAIQRAIRGGVREIPGVRIYERESVVGRAAR